MSFVDPSLPDRLEHLPVPADLPDGWTQQAPSGDDAEELTALLRRHEDRARGWGSAKVDDLLVEISTRGYLTRDNVVLRDEQGLLRGWARAHDRAAGRMLLAVVVDPRLDDALADSAAEALFAWAEEADLDPGARAGVRIRPVLPEASGMPDEADVRCIHQVLESAFADHFNSHEETFEEFVFRLREDPGHRWDHWWIAELVDGPEPVPAGALVGSVAVGTAADPVGSYVEYLGVLESARGRGVAKSLLRTIIADAARRGRGRVGLEVDADSPTGADGLYVSMGWHTKYVTESWHKNVPVA
jgi:ribosomal protein S18 acetylase RimI-like enzyme